MDNRIPILVIGNELDVLRFDDMQYLKLCLAAADEVHVFVDGADAARSAHQFPLTISERRQLMINQVKDAPGGDINVNEINFDLYDLDASRQYAEDLIKLIANYHAPSEIKYVWNPKRRTFFNSKAHENYALINPTLEPGPGSSPSERLGALLEFLDAITVNPPDGRFAHTSIQSFGKRLHSLTPDEIAWLKAETKFLIAYRARAALAGYESVYATADSLIVRGNKILLGVRKFHPGKGLLCLPGGFINPNETALEAALREDSEEVGVNREVLEASYVGSHYYDAPDRDGRAGIVTIASAFVIPGPEPKLKAGDDIAEVHWIEIGDLYEPAIAADHYKIIKAMGRRFHIAAITDVL